MANYKDIESALIEIIKVAYSQGTKKYDKMGLTYVGYLKTMRCKRDPDDHCRYVAKQRVPNEKAHNERMAVSKTGIMKKCIRVSKSYTNYISYSRAKKRLYKKDL